MSLTLHILVPEDLNCLADAHFCPASVTRIELGAILGDFGLTNSTITGEIWNPKDSWWPVEETGEDLS